MEEEEEEEGKEKEEDEEEENLSQCRPQRLAAPRAPRPAPHI